METEPAGKGGRAEREGGRQGTASGAGCPLCLAALPEGCSGEKWGRALSSLSLQKCSPWCEGDGLSYPNPQTSHARPVVPHGRPLYLPVPRKRALEVDGASLRSPLRLALCHTAGPRVEASRLQLWVGRDVAAPRSPPQFQTFQPRVPTSQGSPPPQIRSPHACPHCGHAAFSPACPEPPPGLGLCAQHQ